jgi:hypothetical protein
MLVFEFTPQHDIIATPAQLPPHYDSDQYTSISTAPKTSTIAFHEPEYPRLAILAIEVKWSTPAVPLLNQAGKDQGRRQLLGASIEIFQILLLQAPANTSGLALQDQRQQMPNLPLCCYVARRIRSH